MQLASSTAFFCLFSLPPILVILIATLGVFIENLSGDILQQVSDTLGEKGAEQIEEIIQNFRDLADDIFTTIAVSIFLILVATNLFIIVRKNLNQLWNIQVKKSPGIKILIRRRATAFIQVLIGGAVILFSLLVDATVTFVGDFLDSIFPDIGLPGIRIFNTAFSVTVVTIWFTLLYKILPNANIQWKPALVGGFVTAFLFTLGKFLIGFGLANSEITSVFGASGSIILILLFIFYSSLIFYFGASYTKNYGDHINQPIQADKFSKKIQ